MKRKDTKEHSTAYKVGGLGLETLRQVSKNFPTELSVKYSTVQVIESHSYKVNYWLNHWKLFIFFEEVYKDYWLLFFLCVQYEKVTLFSRD